MNLLLATFSEIASYIGYIFIAVFVLLLMITVHELGHYIAGKILGFKINEFSIGFGPKLFSKEKKNGEVFSVRLIPLGGFCAFFGEDADDDDPAAFNNRKPWQRIIVLVSGALMNFLTAVLLIITMFFSYGTPSFKIVSVADSPEYYNYSLEEGDVITSINGKTVFLTTDIMNALDGKKQNEEIPFTVLRDGVEKSITVKLRQDADFKNVEDTKTLYYSLGTYEVKEDGTYGGILTTNVRLSFFDTLGKSFVYSFKLGGTIFTVLGQLLTGKLGISSVGGTITTITVTANAVKTGGLWYLLYIASFIGVNLAVFNLLPVPALDGSRVIFALIEWIFKKPVNRKVEATIHAVGFVLILLFAVLVDLQQCF